MLYFFLIMVLVVYQFKSPTATRFFLKILATGDFMKKVPTATFVLRDRYIVSLELVYTPNTFYMKSAVVI